jgi:hypothetical protein
VNESALDRGVERGRGGIIEWGKHFYRRLAGGHVAVGGYRGENWVVIALRVSEERRLCGLWLVVKDIRVDGHGHVEDVLKVEFWGGIRVGSVDGDLGLEGDVVGVVKGVRIGRLYREGHGDGGREERRRGGGERTGEIVGERPPVRGRGRHSRKEKPLGSRYFSYGISSAPPSLANLPVPLPLNGNILAGLLVALSLFSLKCLLPKQIFPYITPLSTRLIHFFPVRPSPDPPAMSDTIPRLQMSFPILHLLLPLPTPFPPFSPNSLLQTSPPRTFHTP